VNDTVDGIMSKQNADWLRKGGSRRLVCLRVLIGAAALLIATAANAQFNIDLNNDFAPPEAGGGTPSNTFGAAASQPGYWNNVPSNGNGPMALRDLSGQLTNIICTGPAGGAGLGYSNPLNTGDFSLLLNDGNQVGHSAWSFSGITNGTYNVFTYAVWPNNLLRPTEVTISGSITPNPQIVFGQMPGNQFILGVTHCIHTIQVSNGTFTIDADMGSGAGGFVNGFQVVSVPEPSLVLGLSLGLLCLALRNRKHGTR
jgi:hypothetical protein